MLSHLFTCICNVFVHWRDSSRWNTNKNSLAGWLVGWLVCGFELYLLFIFTLFIHLFVFSRCYSWFRRFGFSFIAFDHYFCCSWFSPSSLLFILSSSRISRRRSADANAATRSLWWNSFEFCGWILHTNLQCRLVYLSIRLSINFVLRNKTFIVLPKWVCMQLRCNDICTGVCEHDCWVLNYDFQCKIHTIDEHLTCNQKRQSSIAYTWFERLWKYSKPTRPLPLLGPLDTPLCSSKFRFFLPLFTVCIVLIGCRSPNQLICGRTVCLQKTLYCCCWRKQAMLFSFISFHGVDVVVHFSSSFHVKRICVNLISCSVSFSWLSWFICMWCCDWNQLRACEYTGTVWSVYGHRFYSIKLVVLLLFAVFSSFTRSFVHSFICIDDCGCCKKPLFRSLSFNLQ